MMTDNLQACIALEALIKAKNGSESMVKIEFCLEDGQHCIKIDAVLEGGLIVSGEPVVDTVLVKNLSDGSWEVEQATAGLSWMAEDIEKLIDLFGY